MRLLCQLEERERRQDPDFRLKRGEIFPGDAAAVLALNKSRNPSVFVMNWGFHMDKRLIFNARLETVASKPMFRESLRWRRCLIPASAYYEWDHRPDRPVKYLFRPEDQPVMYMCGLYRIENDPRRPAFTILTQDASADVSCFHDRMPVVIPKELASQWLQQDTDPSVVLQHALEHMTFQPA